MADLLSAGPRLALLADMGTSLPDHEATYGRPASRAGFASPPVHGKSTAIAASFVVCIAVVA